MRMLLFLFLAACNSGPVTAMLGGFEGDAVAERIGEDTFPLETCAGTIDAAWSDHYGVRVTVAP